MNKLKAAAEALILLIVCALTLSVCACGKTVKAEDIDTGDGSELSYNFDLDPFIKVGEYKGVTVTVSPVNVTDDDVQSEIDYTLEQKSTTSNEYTGTVKDGDTVNIDYTGYKDGVAFENGSDTGHNLTIGSGNFIEGFEEGLIGKNVGDTVDVDVTFPEDYSNTDLAGQAVVFKVKINYILVITPPELTDDFVKANTDCDTVDEWKALIRQQLEQKATSDQESEKKQKAWQQVLDNSEVLTYPSGPMTFYKNSYNSYYTSQATSAGYDTLEAYLTANGSTLDEFSSEQEKYAEYYVKEDLVYRWIALKENLDVTDLEYLEGCNNYYENYYKSQFDSVDEFKSYYGESQIRLSLLFDKVTTLVETNAIAIESAETSADTTAAETTAAES
jgi:trigger factor